MILLKQTDDLGTFNTGGSSNSDDDNFDEEDLDFEGKFEYYNYLVITTTTSTTTTLFFIASHISALLDEEKNDNYFPFPNKLLALHYCFLHSSRPMFEVYITGFVTS